MKTRKLILVITVVLCAAAVSWAVYYYSKPAINKDLIELANELNKSCPFMVDSTTRLDNTTALPENTFRYNYTLINDLKKDIDPAIFGWIRQGALNNARTNPDMKEFCDKKIILSYYYKDKNGEFIYKFEVTPADYK